MSTDDGTVACNRLRLRSGTHPWKRQDQSVTSAEQRQDAIDEAAAEWVVRQNGAPLSRAEQRALACWLAESSSHGAALAEAEAAWTRMGLLGSNPGALVRSFVQPARPRAVWRHAAALAASLAMIAAVGAFWLGDPLTMLTSDYNTRPGEQRAVTLADGSTVELGPESAISVRYSDRTREVELLSGQAYFSPKPLSGGERRPFVVVADNGTTRALGTQFTVRRRSQSVDVTVVEHSVEVTTQRGSQVVVWPGQSVRYSEAGLGAVRPVNPDMAAAWRQGSLVFDRVPLAEVVAELNAYRHGRIVIASDELAERTVSGVFDSRNPEVALTAITSVLGIRMASVPPLVTVLY